MLQRTEAVLESRKRTGNKKDATTTATATKQGQRSVQCQCAATNKGVGDTIRRLRSRESGRLQGAEPPSP